jgi:hypothetical protein
MLLAPPRWTIVVAREREQGNTSVQDGAVGVLDMASRRRAPSCATLGNRLDVTGCEPFAVSETSQPAR